MSLSLPQKPIAIYIDADACPVKQEVYRVAERHALKGAALKVFVVSNSPIAVPRDEMVERVVVGGGMDEADNWIAERAGRSEVVITADMPLASVTGSPMSDNSPIDGCIAPRPTWTPISPA